MRQLKNFMKAKKPMWRCGECKCVTLQCWRDNDEFCNCGTSSEGLGVEYVFKNWNGTILKKGSIDEGATPKAPADPTREATAEYTYTFAGWDPEVGPISEDTVYTATYSATTNQYTVSIVPNDVSYGTVDENSLTVEYGTVISVSDNVLTIGTEHVTATAEEGYLFSGWGTLPATVTENLSITATFEAIPTPSSLINHIEYSMDEIEGTISAKLFFETGVSETNYIELSSNDAGMTYTPTYYGSCDTSDWANLFGPQGANLGEMLALYIGTVGASNQVFTSDARTILESFMAGTATASETFNSLDALTVGSQDDGGGLVEAETASL